MLLCSASIFYMRPMRLYIVIRRQTTCVACLARGHCERCDILTGAFMECPMHLPETARMSSWRQSGIAELVILSPRHRPGRLEGSSGHSGLQATSARNPAPSRSIITILAV